MAIIKACLVENEVSNTGKECDVAMGPTAGIIAVKKGKKFTQSEVDDFVATILELINAPKATRCYPIFGQAAPIRNITNSDENDVIATLEDGSSVFIRYGFVNKKFDTTSGGVCYAKALQSLGSAGYDFLEVDNAGRFMLRKNSDNTYSVLTTDFSYSPKPTTADLKNPYRNHFMISYNPTEYIRYGEIYDGGFELLSTMGLIDLSIVSGGDIPTSSGGTASGASFVVTAVGSNGSTINVLYNGVSITGGPVVKTSSESSVSLLGAKIIAAIQANTATNGGFAAGGGSGTVSVSAPLVLGPFIDGALLTIVTTGTITTSTNTAFSGGVYAVVAVPVKVITSCAEQNIGDLFPTELPLVSNFVITHEETSTSYSPSSVSYDSNTKVVSISGVRLGTNKIKGTSAAIWLSNDIPGYDAEDASYNAVVS